MEARTFPSPLWGGGRGWGPCLLRNVSELALDLADVWRRAIGVSLDYLDDPHPLPPPHKGEGRDVLAISAEARHD